MPRSTVLIVDSEPIEASAIRTMLADDRHDFVVADNADAARDLVREQHADLSAVVLDWDLPDRAGVELLSWMKADSRIDEMEVIVHAAQFDPHEVRKGIESGAYYYLTRPFDGPQLAALVRSAVATYWLRSTLSERAQAMEDAFRMLDFGRFGFRTIPEGDLLAIHIASACRQPEAALGLRELMVNAVEHGNLGITYAEKTELMARNALESERERRLGLDANADKRVEVTLQRILGNLEITVSDTGCGFDFERYMRVEEERLLDTHGRGVLMASATLDIEYLPPGNQVRVRLPIEPPSPSEGETQEKGRAMTTGSTTGAASAMLRHLAVGVNGTDSALAAWEYGLALAKGAGGRLDAILVEDLALPEFTMFLEARSLAAMVGELASALGSAADDLQQRITSLARSAGVKARIIRDDGSFFDVFIEQTADASFLLVGRDPARRAAGQLGSKTEWLVREVRKPLLVAPEAYREPVAVMAAYGAKALGSSVLATASGLATALDVPLRILTVASEDEPSGRTRARAEQQLEAFAGTLEFIAESGKAPERIIARSSDDTVLVLGGYGRPQVYRLILGSVTARVMREARGPIVITGKPAA